MGIKVIKKNINEELGKAEEPTKEISKDTQESKVLFKKVAMDEEGMTDEEADEFVKEFIGKDKSIKKEEVATEDKQPATKIKMKAKEVKGTVTKTFHDGSVVNTDEQVKQPDLFDQPTASITVSCSVTRNLGNYESLKFQVSLTMPCVPTEGDIEETYAEVKAWVDNKVEEINDEITADMGD
jgi:hypothetical protein